MPREVYQQSQYAGTELRNRIEIGHEFLPPVLHENVQGRRRIYSVGLAFTCSRCGGTKWFYRSDERGEYDGRSQLSDRWVHRWDGPDYTRCRGGDDA